MTTVVDLLSKCSVDGASRPIEYRDDHAAQAAQQLGIMTRAELRDLPLILPLIDNTIDRGSLTLLAGPWGCCKSLLTLDWLCCAATGKPWQGRQVHDIDGDIRTTSDTTPANIALYVSAEGVYGLDARLRAWEAAWRTPVRGLLTLPRTANLLATSDVDHLADFVRDNGVDLVAIDTLSRCTPGGDENSARDMSTVIRHLDVIRTAPEHHAAVLVVHHTGKDGHTVRGSSVLEAACDTVYQVSGDARCLKLSRTKRKDGPARDDHTLSIDHVDGTDSVILRPVGAVPEFGGNAQRVLQAFRSAFSETGATKAEIRKVMETDGMGSGSFAYAFNQVIKDGALVNIGSDKRPRYVLPAP